MATAQVQSDRTVATWSQPREYRVADEMGVLYFAKDDQELPEDVRVALKRLLYDPRYCGCGAATLPSGDGTLVSGANRYHPADGTPPVIQGKADAYEFIVGHAFLAGTWTWFFQYRPVPRATFNRPEGEGGVGEIEGPLVHAQRLLRRDDPFRGKQPG